MQQDPDEFENQKETLPCLHRQKHILSLRFGLEGIQKTNQ